MEIGEADLDVFQDDGRWRGCLRGLAFERSLASESAKDAKGEALRRLRATLETMREDVENALREEPGR
jgi:hypothetical protein